MHMGKRCSSGHYAVCLWFDKWQCSAVLIRRHALAADSRLSALHSRHRSRTRGLSRNDTDVPGPGALSQTLETLELLSHA